MPLNPPAVHSLRRVFQQAFLVRDVAEPLVSFDESASAEETKRFMEEERFHIVGIRTDGRVTGYVNAEDLTSGNCVDHAKPFEPGRVIPDSTPLRELVLHLRDHPRLFVAVFGRVGGIVTRTDLRKPPVRMWLFGMVTLIEMRFNRLIDRFCADWEQYLSDARVQKAKDLLTERARRDQDLTLLDCLQLSDKAQIVARNADLRQLTRFQSRRQVENAAKMIEKLRNNLAHTQDITSDWDAIVALSENMDGVLDGPPGLREEH